MDEQMSYFSTIKNPTSYLIVSHFEGKDAFPTHGSHGIEDIV